MDLKEIYNRKSLELRDAGNGKFFKPKAPFTLTLEQRRSVYEWVKSLRVPDGYSSNLSRCIDVRTGRLFGMKSHDYHIFIQCLLPTTFSYVLD
ncbi:hypothetical protein MA16_Dca014479 [Dendrobium catenatum]|uniref:Uncharacterized protein n=1 Tax=Dendrobium catenatum TaxID=906689 RepID=A0A2I0W2Z7_9ASPA|nr:hypothetical protein MA16_Dca014479 [Dendrobium catenatum]